MKLPAQEIRIPWSEPSLSGKNPNIVGIIRGEEKKGVKSREKFAAHETKAGKIGGEDRRGRSSGKIVGERIVGKGDFF